MALLMVVGAVFSANAANDKGGKKKGKKGQEKPLSEMVVSMATPVDTISYADGVAISRGVIPYAMNVLGLDTLYMDAFRQGFDDAIAKNAEPQYTAYNVGTQIAWQLMAQIFPKEAEFFESVGDSIEAQNFYKGFIDGVMNDTTYYTIDKASEYAKAVKDVIVEKQNEEYKAENAAWLEENKTKEGVITLPSGLQYKVIEQGDGAIATDDNIVNVKYEGKLIDGTVFDSSYTRKPDVTRFKPSKVIPGWQEALQMMPEGSKWELYIPQELGYGEKGTAKIKPNSTLIFTVELVKVE